MKKEIIRCQNCSRVIDPDKAVWLELSLTDGRYYTAIPERHESQGGFSFGPDCALAELRKNNLPLIETIYRKHLEAFKEGLLEFPSKGRRFKSQFDLVTALKEGILIPEIWRECAVKLFGTYKLLGLYSLLAFSSKKDEAKHKEVFLAVIQNLFDHV